MSTGLARSPMLMSNNCFVVSVLEQNAWVQIVIPLLLDVKHWILLLPHRLCNVDIIRVFELDDLSGGATSLPNQADILATSVQRQFVHFLQQVSPVEVSQPADSSAVRCTVSV